MDQALYERISTVFEIINDEYINSGDKSVSRHTQYRKLWLDTLSFFNVTEDEFDSEIERRIEVNEKRKSE